MIENDWNSTIQIILHNFHSFWNSFNSIVKKTNFLKRGWFENWKGFRVNHCAWHHYWSDWIKVRSLSEWDPFGPLHRSRNCLGSLSVDEWTYGLQDTTTVIMTQPWVTMALVILLLALCLGVIKGHNLTTSNPRDAEPLMRIFSNSNGVMVSFEQPVYTNGKFTPFHGWNMTNDKYRAVNITYIVRVEFDNAGFKENRIRRHFKRFWLPGAIWVERSTRDQNIYNR